MNINPVNGRVLLKKLNKDSKTLSGILLPELNEIKPDQGIILKINNKNVVLLKNEFKIGDHVLFNRYSGQTIKLNDQELILIKEEDILAVID